MTRPVKAPSKLVPSIPVRPNRNAPFHLMYQPNSPGFWVEWKSPHKIDIITLQHLCHSGKTIVLIKSTLYCGTSTLNHLKKWLKNCSISKPLFQKRWKAFDLWKQSDNARARLENVVENWIHSSPGGSTQQSFIRWCSAPRSSQSSFTLFYTIFDRKCAPFRIPSIDKWNVFHIPTLELCIPYNNCKYIVFKMWIIKTTEHFPDFFTAIKCICEPYGSFYIPK